MSIIIIGAALITFVWLGLYIAYLRQRGGSLTLTSDELEDIGLCEDYHRSGKGIDHPEWDEHQLRISSLVERGVYMEQNEYGYWMWHKETVEEYE